MKVLLTTPFDLALPGGVNDHVLHLEQQLRNMGHTTRILAPCSGVESGDGHVYQLGKVVPIPVNGSTARVTLSPFISGKVKAFLRREQFDVIHLHEPLTPTLPLLVLWHSRSINVGTFHASGLSDNHDNLGYRLGKPMLRYFMDRLHSRVAVSASARAFIKHWFPGDYQIIPNGVDYDSFGNGTLSRAGHIGRQPTVLFIGRYNEPRKGFRHLLEAFKIVQQESPQARLLVVGPGDPEPFQQTIWLLGLNNVVFMGEVPRHALPEYYATADVFCAPSTGRESFGIVLLEGMAAGKPVVATDIDGYRAVVRHEREGLLVKPENPKGLARAVLRIFASAALAKRLGDAGRSRAREFSWPLIASQVVQNYVGAIQLGRESLLYPSHPSSLADTTNPS